MENIRHLPLRHAYNVRDLGGYWTTDGKITSWRKFLRADAMDKLDQSDIEYLKGYGLKTVIDLRSEDEAQREPDVFEADEDIDYINIPLMVGKVGDITLDADSFHIELKDFYLALLKEKEIIKRIMEKIAGASQGCVLFHCTAGKDRTGIVAMILLALAHVRKTDIIADYEISYTLLKENPHLKFDPKRIDISVIFSKPETILACLETIESNYGSVKEYICECGVSKTDIERIIARLV